MVFAHSICQGLWRINQTQVHWGHCSATAAARKQQRCMRAGKAAGMTLNISEPPQPVPWDRFQHWQLLICLYVPGRNLSGKWRRNTN